MTTPDKPRNFIDEIVHDFKENSAQPIVTRFPPEPNGYLHIGHAKSICLNFTVAARYGGRCNLRFDDTNPTKEDTEYVDSIMEDIRWLGFDWGDHLHYASDYFEAYYRLAELLIQKGKAFVCSLTPEQMREYRGTLKQPGKNSPDRDRSVEQNLDLFRRMRAGEFEEGRYVLRAKIDMASPNLNMRDPILYRVMKANHHRTGDTWCIYPMYDFAHPLGDAQEQISQSVCTMEFEDHRPLYDWVIRECECDPPPHQYEFARLNLTRTVMSKRLLRRLVESGVVEGWDDPRMPTISGLRRRGYTPEAIRDFCERIGVAKSNSTVDIALLEHCVREDLKAKAHRGMAVLRPILVEITNYPPEQTEWVEIENNPEVPELGSRKVLFSREVYIDASDFEETPPPKYFRMTPGKEVRLKGAYILRCEGVVRDDAGEIQKVLCTYDPDTKGGNVERKVKGTLHWVSAQEAVDATVRLYDYLLKEEDDGEDFMERLNPESLVTLTGCKVEPLLANAQPGDRFQFMRDGYYVADAQLHAPGQPVFNRIVGLKDGWGKQQRKG